MKSRWLIRKLTIFYDIYTAQEKLSDPRKNNTGLFFFRGKPNEKFAICNASVGFYYVGAMHDSFPHALEWSKRGYNAFALIYRPDAQLVFENLARAIAFVHEHVAFRLTRKMIRCGAGSTEVLMAALLLRNRAFLQKISTTELQAGGRWTLG